MTLKVSPEVLMRDGLGPLDDNGKHKRGVWVVMDFTSPADQRSYKRGEFFERPGPVIQWLANHFSPYVMDLRSSKAKRRSLKEDHDLLLQAELQRREKDV